MKRWISIVLALCLMLGLAACGVGANLEGTESGDVTGNGASSGNNDATVDTSTEMKTIYVPLTHTRISRVGEEEEVGMKITNEYDDAGRLVCSKQADAHGNTLTFMAEHDEHGRVSQMNCEYDGGLLKIDYTYDNAGNTLTKITTQDGVTLQAEQYTYDSQGNVLTQTMEYAGAEKHHTVFHYEQGRLVKEEIYRNNALAQYELYFYDGAGIVTSSEIHMENDALWATNVYTYSDDGLTTYVDCEKYRLQSITVKDAAGNLLRTESVDVGGATVNEYTYLAVQIPVDTPRKNG